MHTYIHILYSLFILIKKILFFCVDNIREDNLNLGWKVGEVDGMNNKCMYVC